MSYLRRIPRPDPEPTPCAMMLAELTDVWAVLRLISERLAMLEASQPDKPGQARPERPSDLP